MATIAHGFILDPNETHWAALQRGLQKLEEEAAGAPVDLTTLTISGEIVNPAHPLVANMTLVVLTVETA